MRGSVQRVSGWNRVLGRVFSPGILATLAVLLTVGLSHMALARIIRAGLADIAYWLFILFGVVLLFAGRRLSAGGDAALGTGAGVLFWSAFGEVGQGGELFEEPAIWSVVAAISIFLVLRPGTRCDLFVAIQRGLGIYRAPVEEARWRAPIVAFEFFWLTWLGHMLLLTAYYNPAFGVDSRFTWAIFVASLALTPYLLFLIWRTHDWAQAWGRGIAGVIIIWTWIEILTKWGVITRL